MSVSLKLGGYTAWQLMELDACVRCGECIAWCPTFAENGLELAHPLGKIGCLREWVGRQYGLRARLLGRRPIEDEEIAALGGSLYSCTLCARCREVCPVQIDTRPLWVAMREQMAELGACPPALAALREKMVAHHNIAGQDNAGRLGWAENLPQGAEGLAGRRAEMVYFVGCVAAFYPLAYSIPQSLAQTLAAAGADFTTLGGEEWCCGFPLIIAGLGAEARALAQHNVEAVRATGAHTLVTACPSCLHTWRHDYPRLLGEPLGFTVRHATEVLVELVEGGHLKLGAYVGAVREPPLRGGQPPLPGGEPPPRGGQPPLPGGEPSPRGGQPPLPGGEPPLVVTYHDPCDLGRTCGIYEAPRRLLRAIPGVELREMKDNRELALCCGGGGDVEMADPGLTTAMALRRLAQARETGAEAIVSACQQCKRTLAGAARREGLRMRVLDITEVVWRSVTHVG